MKEILRNLISLCVSLCLLNNSVYLFIKRNNERYSVACAVVAVILTAVTVVCVIFLFISK